MNEPVAAPAPITTPESELEAVPSTWPGAFGLYKHSKAAVKFNLNALIYFWLIAAAAFVVYLMLVSAFSINEGLQNVISSLGTAILAPPALLLLFSSVDRKKTTVGEAFSNGMQYVVRYFIQSVLVSLILVASLLALVIPFFFVLPRLVLAPYFLVRKDLGIVDSIKASWNETKGHAGKVYGVLGAYLAMSLLFITIIGIPFAIYFLFMYAAAYSILYVYIAEGAGKAEAAPAAAQPLA